MTYFDTLHAETPARVLVTGPRHTPAQRTAIETEAAFQRAEGHTVSTPWDVQATADGADWNSVAFARAKADLLIDGTDVLVLVPGWESDAHALASRDMAESLEIPLVFGEPQ